MLGQRRVGTFIDRGEEYDIIVQGLEANRRQPSDLTNILVRSERIGRVDPAVEPGDDERERDGVGA